MGWEPAGLGGEVEWMPASGWRNGGSKRTNRLAAGIPGSRAAPRPDGSTPRSVNDLLSVRSYLPVTVHRQLVSIEPLSVTPAWLVIDRLVCSSGAFST